MFGEDFEKPIDLVLRHIESMKETLSYRDKRIDQLQKDLINNLNDKAMLEEKIYKWTLVADKFKFKKKV